MKYFFVSDTAGNTHIVVAASLDRAREIAQGSGLEVTTLYELTEDTFKDEGFLISSGAAQENDTIALNSKWKKLVVFDMRTNEEIAVITQDCITTADDAIVVRMTPCEISVPVAIRTEGLHVLNGKVKELANAVEKATSLADEVASLGKGLSVEIDV